MATQETFINAVLEAIMSGDTYTGGTIQMGLFKTGLPSTTGVEVSGGSYARQTLTFGAADNKQIATSTNIVFSDLPTGAANTIVAYGIYDDGTLIDEGTLTSPFTPDVTNNQIDMGYTFDLSET